MWTLFLVSGLLASSPQQSTAAPTATGALQEMQARAQGALINRADPLELTLAAPLQLPNGRRLGASVRPADVTDPWFVYSRGNLCQSVITHGPAPGDATEGWKIAIVQRSRTTTQVTLGVTWSRMWERGRLATSPSGGTSELTLQRGDRIALDTITRGSDPAQCPATTKSLELQVGANTINAPVPAGDSPLDGIVDAELWMVHTAPNGVETVEHQVVRLVNGVIGFEFRGGPVDTSDGPVAIELSGQLKAVKRDDGRRGLWAALTRGVTRQSTGTTLIAGPTPTTVDWPATGDVVQIDLPPLLSFAGGRGGGRGGAVSARGSASGGAGTGAAAAGSQGGGGGVGGAVIASTGRSSTPPPNLLEGHKLALRVRLSENPR